MDEVLGLPTDKAARIALRTQQVIAYETGAANTIDPLGGSYFVEELTQRMEKGAQEYFDRIDELGGVIPAIERGFFQKEIADASFRFQQGVEAKRRVQVGVNEFTGGNEDDQLEILRIDHSKEVGQVSRVQELRRRRDNARVEKALVELKKVARTPAENTMPYILEAVRAYATEGEIMQSLIDVWGTYTEQAII
jgi:methylmalonyl-CoA mutase N-terminal domain/subunit